MIAVCVRLFFFFFLRELGVSFLLFSLFFSSNNVRNKLRGVFDLFWPFAPSGPSVVFEPFAGVAPSRGTNTDKTGQFFFSKKKKKGADISNRHFISFAIEKDTHTTPTRRRKRKEAEREESERRP